MPIDFSSGIAPRRVKSPTHNAHMARIVCMHYLYNELCACECMRASWWRNQSFNIPTVLIAEFKDTVVGVRV